MREAAFIITVISIITAVYYSMTYGKLHNSPQPLTKIIYQPTPAPTAPLKPVIFITTQPRLTQRAVLAGQCLNLPAKKNILEMYKKDKGKDCGALGDNEALIEEAQTKQVFNCLNEGLAGCSQRKAYFFIQGFEGTTEILATTENCRLYAQQWATFEPYCGFLAQTCDTIADTFPLALCARDR